MEVLAMQLLRGDSAWLDVVVALPHRFHQPTSPSKFPGGLLHLYLEKSKHSTPFLKL